MNDAASQRYALIAGSGFAAFGRDDRGSRDDARSASRPVTRFGAPSSPIRMLRYGAHEVLTLARHGDDIGIAPHQINYRANLAALRELGATAVIALNTVGVIPRDLEPGSVAVPAQIIDYTWGRAHSIYDDGAAVDHIDFTRPFSESLREGLLTAASAAGISCHAGGTYGVTQGPRLESAAEVDRFERDGVDFLGMTAMPEASLARELGLDYACLSLLVNRAAGRGASPIHADIEASTQTAKNRAMSVLKRYFAGET